MIVVAGPPGSGKSTAFPIQAEGVDFFNVDDRAAELNGGSYLNIPPDIRSHANRALKYFIWLHTVSKTSFAFETTLRTSQTSELAKFEAQDFFRVMTYVSLNSADECIQRVMNRAHAGGHSTPPEIIRHTYAASISNLAEAFKWFNRVDVYDNSAFARPPLLILTCLERTIAFKQPKSKVPNWIWDALRDYEPGWDLSAPLN
jgi:predicted ABC-type ATPase